MELRAGNDECAFSCSSLGCSDSGKHAKGCGPEPATASFLVWFLDDESFLDFQTIEIKLKSILCCMKVFMKSEV